MLHVDNETTCDIDTGKVVLDMVQEMGNRRSGQGDQMHGCQGYTSWNKAERGIQRSNTSDVGY